MTTLKWKYSIKSFMSMTSFTLYCKASHITVISQSAQWLMEQWSCWLIVLFNLDSFDVNSTAQPVKQQLKFLLWLWKVRSERIRARSHIHKCRWVTIGHWCWMWAVEDVRCTELSLLGCGLVKRPTTHTFLLLHWSYDYVGQVEVNAKPSCEFASPPEVNVLFAP